MDWPLTEGDRDVIRRLEELHEIQVETERLRGRYNLRTWIRDNHRPILSLASGPATTGSGVAGGLLPPAKKNDVDEGGEDDEKGTGLVDNQPEGRMKDW